MHAYSKCMSNQSQPQARPVPDASPPERSLGYRLWMLRHAWTRRVEAVLDPTGLTHMQFFVLRAIEHVSLNGGMPSQARIAEFLRVDRMTVSKVVRTLETRNAVARDVHPDDCRANSVALTPEGDRMVKQATDLVLTEQDRFFGRIGPDMLGLFDTLVDQLLDPATPKAAPEAAPEAAPGAAPEATPKATHDTSPGGPGPQARTECP